MMKSTCDFFLMRFECHLSVTAFSAALHNAYRCEAMITHLNRFGKKK